MLETSIDAPEPLVPATERRFTQVSWFCAFSPSVLLFIFITLGIHLRLGLGHWPTPMFEDYRTPVFDFHVQILLSFLSFALYGAGPLWLLCLLVRPLRPLRLHTAVAQLVLCAMGWVSIFGFLTFDPTTFSAWCLD